MAHSNAARSLVTATALFIVLWCASTCPPAFGQVTATEWFDSAMKKNQNGDVDGTIADLTRAIELDPKFALAYARRAAMKLTRRDVAGAVSDASRAIALDPNLGMAYDNRGTA